MFQYKSFNLCSVTNSRTQPQSPFINTKSAACYRGTVVRETCPRSICSTAPAVSQTCDMQVHVTSPQSRQFSSINSWQKMTTHWFQLPIFSDVCMERRDPIVVELVHEGHNACVVVELIGFCHL